MPSLRTDKGNQWLARVVINGKQVACKYFPSGKKHGAEWRTAKEWEEELKKQILTGIMTLTGLEQLTLWGNKYLDHAERTTSNHTYQRKKRIMRSFFTFCSNNGIRAFQS